MSPPTVMPALALVVIAFVAACQREALSPHGSTCPPPPDFAVAWPPPPDFAHGPSTGDPCTRDTECPAGGGGPGVCLRDDGWRPWPDGYCTSPCDPARNDPATHLDPECPGPGTCRLISLDGREQPRCLRVCYGSSSLPCGWRYNCEYRGLDSALVCEPGGEPRECEWRRTGTCGAGKTCVLWMTDLVGDEGSTCERACDLLSPPPDCNCQRNQLGEGFCTDPAPPDMGAGSTCNILWNSGLYNHCPSGLGCLRHEQWPWQCFRYCTPETAEARCADPCPTCLDVRNGVGICARSE